MRDKDGTKWLAAARLAELLRELPPSARVMPNTVGNLLVLDEYGDYWGFIDFAGNGSLELEEEE